jgi:hypothetical protein
MKQHILLKLSVLTSLQLHLKPKINLPHGNQLAWSHPYNTETETRPNLSLWSGKALPCQNPCNWIYSAPVVVGVVDENQASKLVCMLKWIDGQLAIRLWIQMVGVVIVILGFNCSLCRLFRHWEFEIYA